jgi:hypothetical protein
MKRPILLGLMISTLFVSMIVPTIAQTPQPEQQQQNLSKLTGQEVEMQNLNKLNPRFKEACQRSLNKLNPRFKEARRRNLGH